ncbi:methyltransferase domain-containing protein [Klebsiella oxytoca]|uniref:Methyltransferase domain-containing protein n=2 Tax=Klebsiella oxytoca TaxID=571 RepID=A0A6B8MKR5_KLEOX|nr:methyltransferase domain-containing protein [Klebsiella oxytoca]
MNKFSPENCPKDYVYQNMMGPNVLRLTEELSRSLELWPGMRILDLGCGTGLSSMYLASEFAVEVVAADLWIQADDNALRFAAAGMDNKLTPINLDISTSPGLGFFARDAFDAIVSVNAWHYFGSDIHFFDRCIAPYIKNGGTVAIVVPGLRNSDAETPPEIRSLIEGGMNLFTTDHWRSIWSRSQHLEVSQCRHMTSGRQSWLEWQECENEFAVADTVFRDEEIAKHLRFIQTIGQIIK